MWNTFDKRKFPRIPVKCEVVFEEKNTNPQVVTETENIGEGGVCVILKDSIAPFSKVNIKLKLDETGINTIECAGKVVWCIRSEVLFQDNACFDTGVEFLDIKPKDKELIQQFIADKV